MAVKRTFSIRARLAWWIVGTMLFIVGGMGSWAMLVTNHEAEEIFSARLATSARVLESLTANQLQNAQADKPLIIALPPELEHVHEDDSATAAAGHPYESKIAFQVWHADGRLLARSATAPLIRLGPLKSGFQDHIVEGTTWHVFALQSGQVWVLAAEKDDVRTEMSEELTESILTPIFMGALLLLVVVQAVALYSLRPLQTLADTLADRDADSLEPVELDHAPAELRPVITELNQLMQRMQDLMSREKGFIDAAAHELRTPMAGIQIHLQNAMQAGSTEEMRQSVSSALAGIQRASGMAEQLLVLSRIRAHTDDQPLQNVDLADLCRDVIAEQEPILSRRGQSVALEATQPCPVRGDAHKLSRLIRNLLDNASKHGDPQGEITITVQCLDRRVNLSVANDGQAIPDVEKPRIFDPYHRVAGAVGEGSGLGLAIVREIVLQHQGQLSVSDLRPGTGAVFVVDLPQA